MKKILALVLAVAMVMAMSTTAFAAGDAVFGLGSLRESEHNIEVYAAVRDSSNPEDIICVDIKWDDMTFYYVVEGAQKWDPDTLTYVDIEENARGWDVDDEKIIEVYNRSNVEVTVYMDFYKNEEVTENIVVLIDQSGTRLLTPATNGSTEPVYAEFVARMASDSDPIEGEARQIGNITVTVRKNS